MDRDRTKSLAQRVVWLVLALLIVVLAIASLLPLVETNAWWIRFLDFPRLQFALALLAAMLLFVVLAGLRGAAGWIVLGLGAVALGYHGYKLYPYAPPMPVLAVSTSDCPADARLRVLVANVQRSNEQAEELLDIAAEVDPDLFLLLETDAWWDQQLVTREGLPHSMQFIPDNAVFYGMHLLSRFPLVDPEVRFFFEADTPSILAGIRLPNGAAVDFVGLHPRPPQVGQPTTMRDAHLYAAALAAADSEAASIVAGDFNAVLWERATRRAMRIGGLLDPRVGRGLHTTYATDSVLESWPLDHVLFEDSFGVVGFRTLRSFGSDHYPVLAELCHAPSVAREQSAPPVEADDLQEADAAIQAARTVHEQMRR